MNKKPILSVAFVSLILLGIFVVLILNSHDYDPTAFVLSGSRFSQAEPQGTTGYDGQFAYYIALDPSTAYRYMDEPGKRYQRILLPILAWMFSWGGNPMAAPWALLGINITVVILTVTLLAVMLQEQQSNPWLALTYIFYIGTLFCIRADLNEPLAVALSLSGWFLYHRRNLTGAVVLFALAGLAKEIGLIFPLAIACWELLHNQKRRALIIFSFSLLPYLILFGWLQSRWGVSTGSLMPNWLPFSGIAVLQDRAFLIVVATWFLCPIVMLLIFLFKDILSSPKVHWNLESFLVLINIAFLSILPIETWQDPLAIFRSAIPLVLAAMIWMAKNHRKLLLYLTAFWASSCILLFITPGMVF